MTLVAIRARRPRANQVAATKAAVEWYLRQHYGRASEPGVVEMFCDPARVGAFAVERRALRRGEGRALFRLLVATAMFQRLRDVQVLRILQGLSTDDADEIGDMGRLLAIVDEGECEYMGTTTSLVERCDLSKDPRTRHGCCRANRDVACHLKRHTVLLKRYGHFGKVPTSIALMVREAGVEDLAELRRKVLEDESEPLARAKALEQALSRAWRVNQKIASMFAMHARNHPETKHYTESVWEVDPRKATGGKPVALAWFSPDCKHHSKAKGGKPREQKIRGLAWVAVTWAQRVRPRLILLENVEEFQDWGPLHRTGERAGQPIKERKGETFRAFVAKLRHLGYTVEWRLLRACDFGAPTTRRRLFLQASLDGIAWPEPTHGPGRAQPYRTAAECIDWSIPCPSIFSRERPLADQTLARIARGIRKYVLEAARPFVLHVTHGGRENSIDEPFRTVTAAHRGEMALVAPYLVHRSNGERVGQEPRIYSAQEPLRTIVSQGEKFALCAAFLAKHYGDRPTGGWPGGASVADPFGAVTVRDHHSLVAANLVRYNGDQPGAERVSPLDEPLGTQDTARRYALVASFLSRYNGTSTGQSPDEPLSTIDTRDRFGLVTVTIDGEEYAIVDIGMRMLTPRELFRAQGFPEGYTIDPIGPNGKPLTKTAQIRMCGNSVSPVMPLALLRARRAA